MKLAQSTEVALRACVHLLRNPQQVFPVYRLAESLSTSKSHLAKVMQALTRAGITESVRGIYGGFRMANDEVSVLDVIEAMDETLVSGHPTSREVRTIRNAVKTSLTETLGNLQLLDL